MNIKNKKLPVSAIKNKFIKILRRDKRINFVLLLGSSASDTEDEYSDIDVCIVMKDDQGLNEFLLELNIMFNNIGKVAAYYNYNPYHYYIIFDGIHILDLYIISSSLYFNIKNSNNKMILDNRKSFSQKDNINLILEDLFIKASIRSFRLISKINKKDYLTIIYILNSIRDEQLFPLISLIFNYKILHSKSIKLDHFDKSVRQLVLKLYPHPTEADCLMALKSIFKLLLVLFSKSNINKKSNIEKFIMQNQHKILNYETSRRRH